MKITSFFVANLIIVALCGCLKQDSQTAVETVKMPRSPVGFIKGFSWGTFGRNGDYTNPHAEKSMKLLAETNANFVSIVFAMMMKTADTPEILYDKTNPYMTSDDDIRNAIRLARQNNLGVILKPVVNCADGQWRGYIDFKTADGRPDSSKWQLWWENYTEAMLHYAKLAQDANCRLFCIGCEMNATESFENQWRNLIAKIREVYKDPLVYNVNHGRETELTWWDAVDFIGISAYYPLRSAGIEEMNKSWAPIRVRLRELALKWSKPVLFMEIGVCSTKGSSAVPWEYDNDWPYDGAEQARYYQAAFENFWDEPWFAGYAFWAWHWYLYPKEKAVRDRSYCPYGKPAEDIVKSWYSKKR